MILADDLITSEGPSVLEQMRDAHAKTDCSVIGVQEIEPEDSRKYGVIKPGERHQGSLVQMADIVEKPEPAAAPSNLGVVGRYILTPRIFELLKTTPRGAGGEIQLTDAIAELLKYESVWACPFIGKRYDCGSKLGYLEATVELALQHPELKDEVRDYLLRFTQDLK